VKSKSNTTYHDEVYDSDKLLEKKWQTSLGIYTATISGEVLHKKLNKWKVEGKKEDEQDY